MNERELTELLKMLGFTPDKWQIKICMAAEKLPEIGVSIPRQNGKTELALMLAAISGCRGENVLFTAHNGDATRAAERRMSAICKPLEDIGIVSKQRLSPGFEFIEFTSGGRISFRIRTAGAAVGMTLDRIIFDEAQKMSTSSFAEIIPTLTTSTNRSIIMLGTPPTDDDIANVGYDSVFAKKRNDCMKRVGNPTNPERGWFEYGIGTYSKNHSKFTLATAKKANPSSSRIPDFNGLIRREMATMDDEAYARQRLGAWVIPDNMTVHAPALKPEIVRSCLTNKGTIESRFYAGIGVNPSCSIASVCFAVDGWCEIVKTIPIENGDVTELVKWVRDRSRMIRNITIPQNSRGKAIQQMLSERGIKNKLKSATMPITASKAMQFIRAVKSGTMHVFDSPESNIALSTSWLGFDDRSGSATIEAADPDVMASMLSIVLAYHPSDVVVDNDDNNDNSVDDGSSIADKINSLANVRSKKQRVYSW